MLTDLSSYHCEMQPDGNIVCRPVKQHKTDCVTPRTDPENIYTPGPLVKRLDADFGDMAKNYQPHEKYRLMRSLAIRLENSLMFRHRDWARVGFFYAMKADDLVDFLIRETSEDAVFTLLTAVSCTGVETRDDAIYVLSKDSQALEWARATAISIPKPYV